MSQKNWKLLFQEKTFFLKLMESASGRLARSEALALVQGEGRRLDELVRSDWVLILDDNVFPGPGLIMARQFSGADSTKELKALWDFSRQYLGQAMSEMRDAGELSEREKWGASVFERVVAIRTWTFLLHAAVLRENAEEAGMIALEFESLAGELRGATLRSSGSPEWEVEQWELIDFLEEQASFMRLGDQNQNSDRLQKLNTISSLQKEDIPLWTNLESLVESDDFLLLHKKLGVVAWPFFPPRENTTIPAVGQDSFQLTANESFPHDLIPQWKASGLDLLSFLGQRAAEMNVTEAQKLSTFSRILAESGEGLMWKKDLSGTRWEVWPGN